MHNRKNKFLVPQIKVTCEPSNFKTLTKVNSPEIAAKLFYENWDKDLLNVQEQFCVLFLNKKSEAIGFRCICTGTVDMVTIDYKLIFTIAYQIKAASIIVAHNHPSGGTQISDADFKTTEAVQIACGIMDIRLLDHLILTQNTFVSLSDCGVVDWSIN